MTRAGEHLAALGITGVADAAGEAGGFVALREAERRGELPVRVTMMFTYPEAAWLLRAGMTTGYGSDRLRLGAIKLWADGGMNSRTAALDEPYLDPPGEMGLLWYTAEQLTAIVRDCDAAGFQVGIHAQGERGIRMALAGAGGGHATRQPPPTPDRARRLLHPRAARRRRPGSASTSSASPASSRPWATATSKRSATSGSAGLYPFASLRERESWWPAPPTHP